MVTPWTVPGLMLDRSAGDPQLVASAVGRCCAALNWNLAFVAALVVAVAVAGVLGRLVFVTEWGRTVGTACVGGAVLAGLAAGLANGLLLTSAGGIHLPWTIASAGISTAAQACALIAVVIMGLAAPVAITAVTTTLVRLTAYYILRRGFVITKDDLQPSAIPPDDSDTAYWQRNWALPPKRPPGGLGICLSGGGVRSAVFGIGALQVVAQEGRLGTARYLVGVSGGGYAAGAMRLGLVKPQPTGKPKGKHTRRPVESEPASTQTDTLAATAEDVFAEGSPEFDYLRRHGKYLAEGALQWLRVFIVVLTGLVIAQLTLLFAAVVCGWLMGVLYGHVPDLAGGLNKPQPIAPGVGWAAAGPAVLGLAISLVGVAVETHWPKSRLSRGLTWLAQVFVTVGLIMAVVGVAIPLLVNGANWLTDFLVSKGPVGPSGSLDAAKTTAATATATIVTTGYVATIVAIFTAVGRAAGSAYTWLNKNRNLISRVPALVVQWLLVVGGATLLVAAHLYVFARVINYVADSGHAHFTHDLLFSRRYLYLGIPLGLFFLATVLIDQTRWSLHPFYRERLATAFAVRRLRNNGTVEAERYPRNEWTYLDTHCTYVDPGCEEDPAHRFPQVILMATANVSGQDLTPPGNHALPYSLSGDWVGSPLLGWIKTSTLRNGSQNGKGKTSSVLGADLTTQAAMAISGAAFASAMGAARSPYSLLFTLTNARLGTWLPNPRFLAHHLQAAGTKGSTRWANPRLPRWRSMPYLLRELFGVYRPDGRLVLATDGGHYDNLGLVEMLRHGPSTIYCFDASGGNSLGGSALGPAIALARQELGVTITFPECPMGVSSVDWAEKELDRVGVLVGKIDYTDCPAPPPRANEDVNDTEKRPDLGVLYFARATVTPDAAWAVQAYRRTHPTFPNDSTSDQWFNQQQFDAYHTLGRQAATAVIQAQTRYESSPGSKAAAPSPIPSQSSPAGERIDDSRS
jgi:hypothetical protein